MLVVENNAINIDPIPVKKIGNKFSTVARRYSIISKPES
jgi:hypothetical protein